MTRSDSLAGRAAVVVGGNNGIGRAVAGTLAANGAAVVIGGRTDSTVKQAVAEIADSGGRAVGVPGSAADETVADALIDTCRAEFGGIDILINCAGTAEPQQSSILDVSTADWQALLDAHLTTAFNTCRAVAPHFVAAGRGAIVNTSSFAYLGDYGGTGYPAGKGAVTSLTMAIAAELKQHGVRANVVCPGARTRLSTGDDYEDKIRDLHQRGMIDDLTMQGSLDAPPAEHVAALYHYLVSDDAEVTGGVFIGAGGFVGRFDRPTPSILGYRDTAEGPWSLPDLHRMITGSST